MSSSRLLAQYLHSYRAAGVRRCPDVEPVASQAQAAASAKPSELAPSVSGAAPAMIAPGNTTAARPSPSDAVETLSQNLSSRRPLATAGVPTASHQNSSASAENPVPTVPPFSGPLPDGSKMSVKKKASELEIVSRRVAACTRCAELADTRTQTVFGVGSPDARLLFVGEAPGADEDKQGEPFVGRAGKLLTDIITNGCGMQREDIYICNVLRCRPPGNRNPTEEEAGNCREYLDHQIAIVNPEFIVCWGSVAARNLLATKTPIGKLRGEFHSYRDARVLCTYHPSYLLRNPSAKKLVWEDMKLLLKAMGLPIPKR